MWFDEDINLTIETDPFINVSGATSFSQIDNVTTYITEQPIIISLSENYAPVQSVNGQIGFVTITKESLGITGTLVTSGDLSNYVTKIDGQFSNRPTVNGTGILLSGEAAILPSTIVYTSGDQTISGQKTFLTSPVKYFWVDNEILSSDHGWLYIDQLETSIGYSTNYLNITNNGIKIYGDTDFIKNPTVNNIKILLSGEAYSLNNPSGFLTSGNLTGNYATITNLASTGSTLNTKINSLSGNLTGNYATITNLASTGSTLNTRITNLSGHISSANSNIVFTTGQQTIGGYKLISGGGASLLQIGGYSPLGDSWMGVSFLRAPFVTMGADADSNVDNLLGFIGSPAILRTSQVYRISAIDLLNKNNVLFTSGNQIISGIKRFNEDVYIKNLFVTGSQTIVSTTNFNVQSPYLILNLTGGAVDGGIFFVTGLSSGLSGTPLTGINDYGPIIGFDHSKNFKFGIARRSDDLSTLNDIAAVQDITNYSGFVSNNYVTKSNGQFSNRPTVNGTGVLLSGEASSFTLPNTILYTTGNQIKSGRLIIGDDAGSIVDPNSTYTLSLQTNSPSTWLEILNHSGANQGVFFGITNNNFEQWNSQAGDILFVTSENPSDGTERLRIKNDGKVGIGTSAPSEKLEVAGNIKANNLVYNTGDQIVSGTKTFALRPTVNGTGVLLSGEAASLPTTIVYTTGDQTISGNKDFYGDEILFSGLNVIFADNTGVSYGQWQFSNRPTVNGTGVLLSGEAAQLPETIVYTNNDQTITGLKTFRSGIIIGEPSQLSTPTIKIFDAANGGYGTFYWEDAQLYIHDVSNKNLYYDFSKYPTGTTQTIAVVQDLETTGSTLNTKINSLSGASVLVYGNQTISGIKTFATGIDILSIGTGIRIIYGTGTNSGEFGILDWSNGQFKINTLGVGSGVTRTVAVGTASSFGSVGVGLYVNTPSNQVSLNASQNSVRVSSSNVEIYARNAAGSATSLHLSAGGDAVRVNKLIASSGADIYFSGNTSIGNLISGFWNNTGIAYTGIYYNVNLYTGISGIANGIIPNTTNILLNLAVNNTGVFNVNSKGQVLINQLGNALSENTLDIRRGGTSIATLRDDGAFGALNSVSAGGTLAAPALTMTSTTVRVGSNCTFAWTNTSNNAFGTTDLVLNRDNANIMAQRNGLSAQQFRVYNYTGTNSGEFATFGWQATGTGTAQNALVIGTQSTQSGILRDVILTGRNINISSSGVIIPNPTVPTSTGSAGTRGQISWDNDFIYVCVSGNSWKRSALTTW